jgi:C4-dicarboxylate transporter, DctM subunit
MPLGWLLVLALAIMLIVFSLRIAIGYGLLIVAIVGLLIVKGPDLAWFIISLEPYRTVENFFLLSVPLFVLTGQLLFYSGLTEKLYDFATKWVGHFRGGLAIASLIACAFFAAANGSSTATAAAVGKVAAPEMIKRGYNKGFATGLLAVGGTLGYIIPPSLGLVLYGIITETSIGHLLVAAVFPGILTAVGYIITVMIVARIKPNWAPAVEKSTWKERFKTVPSIWPFVVIFMAIIGLIYLGVVQSGEAAAIGGVVTILILLVTRRFSLKIFWASLKETGLITVSVFVIILGALLFAVFLNQSRVPIVVGEFFQGLHVNGITLVIMLMILFLILGCFLDVGSSIMIVIPFVLTTLLSLHVNMIWFGIICVRCMEIGLVTPPFGVNVFVMRATMPEVPVWDTFRGVYPFLVCDAFILTLLIAFPQITTFLPSVMLAGGS